MNDEFYIGYQKTMPPGIAAFIRKRMLILLLIVAALSAIIAAVQHPFALASFEFGVVKSFRGIIHAHPYPTLTLDQPATDRDSVPRSRYFLVAPGKHGAQRQVAGWDGKPASLKGSLIYRDGKTMIELLPGSLESIDQTIKAPGAPQPLGVFTLRGEIVDSKCYLGVMKPGNLKPHKSCAIRCISGGIPPVLCVRDEQGFAIYVMLAGPNGEPINREVLSYIAESVEITGLIERTDDLLIMKIDPGMIRRL